jgi:hypothetical protein
MQGGSQKAGSLNEILKQLTAAANIASIYKYIGHICDFKKRSECAKLHLALFLLRHKNPPFYGEALSIYTMFCFHIKFVFILVSRCMWRDSDN